MWVIILNESGEIAEIEKTLKYYALIRSMAGVTFSEFIPEAARYNITRDIQNAFLAAYDRFGSTLLTKLGL